jgi:hypothetical protein
LRFVWAEEHLDEAVAPLPVGRRLQEVLAYRRRADI